MAYALFYDFPQGSVFLYKHNWENPVVLRILCFWDSQVRTEASSVLKEATTGGKVKFTQQHIETLKWNIL